MPRSRRSTATSTKTESVGYPPELKTLPRFGTMRNYSRHTYGPRVNTIGRLVLSKPGKIRNLMPYQQYIADVMGEVDPDTGERWYKEGLISLSRQQGKTELIRIEQAHRALDCTEPQLLQFAAQTGKEAIKKLEQTGEKFARTPLLEKMEWPFKSANGKESLRWHNGSIVWPLSGTEDSGHGDSIDAGFLTEAFAHKDYRVETTMLFGMRARPGAQFWAESAAGTYNSIYWNERIEALRQRYREEPQTAKSPHRVAIFDWSLDEDEDDWTEEASWVKVTPALNHTIRLATLRHEFESADTPEKLRKFKRGALNMTDLGAPAGTVFGDEEWEKAADDSPQMGQARALALDIVPDRSWWSVAWAGETDAGRVHAELIAHERKMHELVPYLVKKAAACRVDQIAVVSGTQASEKNLVEALEAAGLEVLILSRADYAAAVAGYYDGIRDRTITHLGPGQAPLHEAVAGAAFSTSEMRTWSPAKSTTIISPLVAVTAAVRAFKIQQENDYDVLASVG